MINSLSVVTIWVMDQNEALRFYTEKLGFEIRADISHAHYRWLTVGLKGQPELEFHLAEAKPGGGLTEEEAVSLAKLVAAGQVGGGPGKADECRHAYETLAGRGVEFLRAPGDRPATHARTAS